MGKGRGSLDTRRNLFQALWALLTNSYLLGFAEGKIYQGPLKNLCVPGLNCYSCPGAVASCPIGALQAVIGTPKFHISFYIAGFLFLIGAVFGRLVCGWLCPFGLIQDLLHKIPLPKALRARLRTFRADKVLRWAKYGILAVFVILLPMYAVDIVGNGSPYFCSWICPAGTLEAGWPLVAMNEGLQQAVGWLYAWKNVILIVTLVASVLIYRPFCKYMCPLGAVYAVCNPISVYRYTLDEEKCIHCGKCAAVCEMGIDPVKTPNSLECIRCGRCTKVCPTGALTSGWRVRAAQARQDAKAAGKS